VDARVTAGLLDMVDHTADRGWPRRRAAALLGLGEERMRRLTQRRNAGRLDDLPPGGHPVHAILPEERAAILDLFTTWGEVDRSHRKLAHRGSRLGVVHVSESTVLRVLPTDILVGGHCVSLSVDS
jgi:putative transposase